MKITKIEFQKLLNKIVSSLTKHFNDPKVINYNFYDNTSGVGVKMVRKTSRITVNDLAIKLNDLALVVYDLTLEVRAGFAEQKKFNEKQEVFNQKVETFMAEQKVFNEWVKKEITEIKQDIKDIKNCPTVARELKLIRS